MELDHQANGDACLTGATKTHTVWINRVPKPKLTRHRIHLDVHGSSAEDLQALGASPIDDQSFSWVVMADPEGGEFCLFIREAPPPYRVYEAVIDCADHETASRWWASAIGGQRGTDQRGFSYVDQIPNVPFESLCFAPVKEVKQTKNRIHLDLVAESVDALLDAGATRLRRHDHEVNWDVLADPEGNEFCVLSSD